MGSEAHIEDPLGAVMALSVALDVAPVDLATQARIEAAAKSL